MRIKQRCYFAVWSEQMTAEEVTARLGMDPDHVMVRGSRMADPARPALHSWSVDCDEPGLCVDEQIQRVVARLEPLADAIGALVEELIAGESGFAVLQVARFFDYPDGEEDTGDYGVEGASGRHQLLGWHLDRRALDFLDRTHAELDIDEYG